MHDISEFFKALKQRFSQYYNRREDRKGPLWEERFKSLLIEHSEHALSVIAAYIDLNPVRAGIVKDPKDYRYCGYAEALGGSQTAQEGLREVIPSLDINVSWSTLMCAYRKHLYLHGKLNKSGFDGATRKGGFSDEEIEQVLKNNGRLPIQVLLHCRIRYFSDGLVLGSQDFVDEIFFKYRDRFSDRRQTGARFMRSGDWQGLCTMRELKLGHISLP
jgi:hypothetical protein